MKVVEAGRLSRVQEATVARVVVEVQVVVRVLVHLDQAQGPAQAVVEAGRPLRVLEAMRDRVLLGLVQAPAQVVVEVGRPLQPQGAVVAPVVVGAREVTLDRVLRDLAQVPA